MLNSNDFVECLNLVFGVSPNDGGAADILHIRPFLLCQVIAFRSRDVSESARLNQGVTITSSPPFSFSFTEGHYFVSLFLQIELFNFRRVSDTSP